MKNVILSAICFLIITEAASAQTRNSKRRGWANSSAVTTSANTRQKETATTTLEPGNIEELRNAFITVVPDNRKEFMQDGQLATYTGHQATAINTDEFQSARKSDNKIERKGDGQKQ